MNAINDLFDKMDAWRHLPNYQLERRADLFFALYLPRALERKLGIPVRSDMVPEFPVRNGSIGPNIASNQSFKVDYLAFSAAMDLAILVELKTEGLSRRKEQDENLVAAQEQGLSELLQGLIKIFRATTSKRKYFCLFDNLASMGLVDIPDPLRGVLYSDRAHGVNEYINQIKVISPVTRCQVVYVQPNGTGDNVISFNEFAEVVEESDDVFSSRFAESIRRWAKVQAGITKETLTMCET